MCTVDNNIHCRIHGLKVINDLTKQNALVPISNISCMTIDPQILTTAIFHALNKHDIFKTLTEVRIENQPALTNPTMKAVAATVFSYFVFLNITHNLNMKIKYVSPATKIKFNVELIQFINTKFTAHGESKKDKCKCKMCKLEVELKANSDSFGLNYGKYKFSYEVFKVLSVLQTEKKLIDAKLAHKME